MLQPVQAAADANEAVDPPTTDVQDAGLQQVPVVQQAEKQLSDKKVYMPFSSRNAVSCYMSGRTRWVLHCQFDLLQITHQSIRFARPERCASVRPGRTGLAA